MKKPIPKVLSKLDKTFFIPVSRRDMLPLLSVKIYQEKSIRARIYDQIPSRVHALIWRRWWIGLKKTIEIPFK